MEAFGAYTLLGLALGAAYAVAAAGLVVTYTTSGIFNFAHGAVAMMAAYLYWQLRWSDGWGGRWPAPLALLVVVFIAGPLFGALIELLVMRRLRNTSDTTRVVMTIALLLALTGLASWVWGSPQARRPVEFFGATNLVSDSFPVAVLWHDVAVLVTAGGLAAALYVALFRTRFGIVMRAVVDSRSLSQLNGVHPDRTSQVAWALGTAIAALAGVMLSPNLGSLNPLALTLFVANVFAAAVFGRLRSLPLTFAGAIVVGLAVNYWTWFQSEAGSDWTWLSNLRPSLPMVLLIVFLLVLPQERLRGANVERSRERFRVPTVRQAVLWGAVLVAVIAALGSIMEAAPQVLLARGLSFAIIALSVVLLSGYSGELNLAPMAFAGLGAIVAFQVDVGPDGRALVESLSVGALVAAAVVCAMVGVLVALPAVRLRGLYLALATYAFAVVVSNMVFKQASSLQLNIPFVGDGEDIEVNLFTSGVLGVPRPRWFGIDLTRSDDLTQTAWLVFLAAAFALLGVMLVALRRSSYGLRLAALRDSPAAAATLGMNLVRLKTSVFALSAAIAGIGGALMAANQGSVREGDFDVFIGLGLFMLVAVGGVGYVTGALLGGLLFGAGFVVIGDLWAKLADEITTLGPVLRFLEDWFLFLGPAMAGIGLGGNPSGIAARLFEPYAVLKRRDARGAVAIGGSLLAGWYVLAVLGVIGNWIFVIGAALILVAMPRWYFTRHPELDPTRRPRPADVEALDRVGLTDDIDDAQAGAIDRLLELDRLRARVGVGS